MSATVILGDCREAMRGMAAESADAVITDPPYGTGQSGYGRRQIGARTIANDMDLSVFEEAAPEMFRLLKPDTWAVVFCSTRYRADTECILEAVGFTRYGELIWDKKMPSLGYTIRYQHETAVIVKKGEPKKPESPMLSVHRESLSRLTARESHPHRKPVQLMKKLVRFACPIGGVVLDPFAGEGTCGAAAVAEGRGYIGIELDAGWHARAVASLAGTSEQYSLVSA